MLFKTVAWSTGWLAFWYNRELKQRRRRRKRERQKSNKLRSAKQQLCACITVSGLVRCKLLWRHCTTTMWNFLISRFMEEVNTSQRFSSCFCELRYSPLEFNSWNIANIWQIKAHSWNKPRAMKFEIVRIYFSGDVLAAFAFVVALAP